MPELEVLEHESRMKRPARLAYSHRVQCPYRKDQFVHLQLCSAQVYYDADGPGKSNFEHRTGNKRAEAQSLQRRMTIDGSRGKWRNPFPRRSAGFKIIGWIVLAYFLIAVMHGLAPGLWAKSFGGQEYQGPFRLLIFVPIVALYLFFLALAFLLIRLVQSYRITEPESGPPWTAWSLRGPPGYRRFFDAFCQD